MRCPKPISIIDSKTKIARTVPCGQCVVCRINYALDWAFRCYCESLNYSPSDMVFVTLTYSDDYNSGSLCKEHLQAFYKRMRSAGYRFRYFGCGEYGSSTHRPHYHLCLFGVSLDADCWQNKSYCPRSKGWFCTNPYWYYGHCFIGSVTSQSISYCCKYTLKSVKGKRAVEVYDNKGLVRPYCTMSRRPGIGSQVQNDFLLGNNFKHFSQDVLSQVPDLNIALLPRYYLDRLFPPDSESREIFKDRFRRDFERFFGTVTENSIEERYALATQLLYDIERKSEVLSDRSRV